MADVKISGLPASTVPLDGTEVLPIVQGTTTKQVSITNVTAGRVIAASGVTTDIYKAASSAGGTLQANNATACIQWGAGGGSGLIFDGGVSSTAANAALVFSPTGTGTVAISPVGALTINPTAASTINNTSIGVTTAAAGGFTTVKAATTIGVGAATPSASGAGITFPATQSPSSDANTLDDYEEGTWVPTATNFTINSGSATWSGAYTKVGRLVTAYFRVVGGNFTVTAGSTTITLPFTATNYDVGGFTNPATSSGFGGLNASAGSASMYITTTTVAQTQFSGTITYSV